MRSRTVDEEAFVLEVIACSVEDAVNAERGGADRLEVISGFEFGGFAPPLDLVREIQQEVDLPLRVMLRDEEGYGLADEAAEERLCRIAVELNSMKVDGIVIGFLRSNEVDAEHTVRILNCAPDLNATFHHAFEDTGDKASAIAVLKKIGRIDRLLSHGGAGTTAERVDNLDEYASAAYPEMRILAGGRIDIEMVGQIKKRTPIREFHVGRAARDEGVVSVSKVRRLSDRVRGEHV